LKQVRQFSGSFNGDVTLFLSTGNES
jgi:hypothetical protein